MLSIKCIGCFIRNSITILILDVREIKWTSFNSYITTVEGSNLKAYVLNLQDHILNVDLLYFPKRKLRPISVDGSSRIGTIKYMNIL